MIVLFHHEECFRFLDLQQSRGQESNHGIIDSKTRKLLATRNLRYEIPIGRQKLQKPIICIYKLAMYWVPTPVLPYQVTVGTYRGLFPR
jgi:hypothetical protein